MKKYYEDYNRSQEIDRSYKNNSVKTTTKMRLIEEPKHISIFKV